MDLTKLTVPQLKVVCKERRITGYSKLGKAALLQKLTDHSNFGTSTSSTSTTTTDVVPQETSRMPVDSVSTIPETLASQAVAVKIPRAPTKLKKLVPSSSSPSVQQSLSNARPIDVSLRDRHLASSAANHETSHLVPPPIPAVSYEPNYIQPTTALPRIKRPADPLSQDTSGISNKKRKTSQKLSAEAGASSVHPQSSNILSVPNSVPSSAKQSPLSMAPPPVPKMTKPHISSRPQIAARVQPAPIVSKKLLTFLPPHPIPKHATLRISSLSGQIPSNIANTALAPQTIETSFKAKLPGKRFKPLILKKSLTSPQSVPPAAEKSHKAISTSFISATQATSSSTVPLRGLDFPQLPFNSLVFAPITLPPKLSNRKHVHRWSVILSGLSAEERRQCALVSRMFRYSVYLSAVRLLEQKFSGRRLAHLMLKYPQNMTNMWQYLRQRYLEAQMRMQAYDGSFLAKYFKGFDPISEHLCTSPDNERQMTVAVRFILTRLWFSISVGGGSDPLAWSRGIVVDAQEVVKDEIWVVTVQTASSQPNDTSASQTETFYVLEQTCEVVGHPLPLVHLIDSSVVSDGSTSLSNTPQVRADWSAYIAYRQLPSSAHDAPPLPLLAHLKWQNHEDYYGGLSKLWLKRIADEGELGVAKRVVADRYVLACVVGNSVSGRWMSSTQMEQTFAGKAAIIPARAQSQQVHLFLPAHHHVESVHFTAANGRPLHIALAVVQTPGREYYILRDNGAQVGCGLGEEDGVAPVWMELLGCTALGETAIC